MSSSEEALDHGVVRQDPRSNETQKLLVDATIRLLDDGASTSLTARGIASLAGVNHALVAYHFGGLENLMKTAFTQCADALGKDFSELLGAFDAEIEEAHADTLASVSRSHLTTLLQALANKDARRFLTLLTGKHNYGLSAYSLLQERLLTPLHKVFSHLSAKALQVDAQSLEAAVTGQVVLAQVMAFFRGGGSVAQFMGWKTVPEQYHAVVDRIAVDAILRTLGLDDH